MRASYPGLATARWCDWCGYTRQAFYQERERQDKRDMELTIVLQIVRERRRLVPRAGGRKLYDHVKGVLAGGSIKIGRDALFDLLREHGLLVRPKRRRTRTTVSSAWMRRYQDLRVELVPGRSEQLWVADITYLRIRGGFAYLSLIMDAYSRRVVGWCCHDSLAARGCHEALDMALAARRYPDRELIHHTDRGVQYCSGAYTARLRQNGIRISTTQNGSPYENPQAESLNAILKVELGLDAEFADLAAARAACEKQIHIYNTVRKHGSIDYLTPEQAYDRSGMIPKRWKGRPPGAKQTSRERTTGGGDKPYPDQTKTVNTVQDGIL